MNNRATFGTVGKFGKLTADLIPGVIGQKVQAGAEEEYQLHDSIPEEVLKLLKLGSFCQPFRKEFAGYGLFDVSEEQRKVIQ